jgi:hypothetical protein
MNSNIKVTLDKVYIEGLPLLEWGKNNDISFIKSAQLVFNALGENYSYEYLMGISAAAFKFQFHPKCCASAGDITTGFDTANVLFKSVGYHYELITINDNSFEDIRALYKKIKQHINSGIPIIAINLKKHPDWGIITGYLKTKPGILCRTYFDHAADYSLAEHAPWLSYFPGNRKKPLDRELFFRKALETAVQMATTEAFGDYKSGFAAFKKWILNLKEQAQSEKLFKEYEVNLLLFCNLLDCRQAAFKFLITMNDLLKNGNSIIRQYQKECELLKQGQKFVLPSYHSKPKDWTKQIIHQQIDILASVFALEKKVIRMIQSELT